MRPKCIHVSHIEDHPPPASRRTTLLQIEDWTFCIFDAQRREIRIFPAIDNFHTQNIPIEPHRVPHIRNPKSNRRNLSNRKRHARSLPWLRLNSASGKPTVEI